MDGSQTGKLLIRIELKGMGWVKEIEPVFLARTRP
jgi:hypothetical protein